MPNHETVGDGEDASCGVEIPTRAFIYTCVAQLVEPGGGNSPQGSPVRVRPQAPCPRSGMGPPSGFGLELWTVWIGTDNAANKPNLARKREKPRAFLGEKTLRRVAAHILK